MAWQLMSEVLNHAPSTLTAGERLVLVAIAEAVHQHNLPQRRCTLQRDDLARLTGLTRSSVTSTLTKLRNRGLDVRVPLRPTGGRRGKDGTSTPVYAYPGTAPIFQLPPLPAPDNCPCADCRRSSPPSPQAAVPGKPPSEQSDGPAVTEPSAAKGSAVTGPSTREGSVTTAEGSVTTTEGSARTAEGSVTADPYRVPGLPSNQGSARPRERRRAATAAAERRRAAVRQRAEQIAACALCDARGYTGTVLCDHDPTRAQRTARGSAAVRAALAASGTRRPRPVPRRYRPLPGQRPLIGVIAGEATTTAPEVPAPAETAETTGRHHLPELPHPLPEPARVVTALLADELARRRGRHAGAASHARPDPAQRAAQ